MKRSKRTAANSAPGSFFDAPYKRRAGSAVERSLAHWGAFEPFASELEAAMSLRNVERWAHHVGVELIAMLVQSGRLGPGQDPREALAELLGSANKRAVARGGAKS